MYWNPTSKPYHFRFFKGCLLQILLGPFLNTLTHIVLLLRRFAGRLIWIKNLLIKWRKDSGNQPCRKVMSLFLLSGCSTDSRFSWKLNRMPKNFKLVWSLMPLWLLHQVKGTWRWKFRYSLSIFKWALN